MKAVRATSHKESTHKKRRASYKATQSTGPDKLARNKGRTTSITGNNLQSLILSQVRICTVLQNALPKAMGGNLWNINSVQLAQFIGTPAQVARRDELPDRSPEDDKSRTRQSQLTKQLFRATGTG